MFRLTQIHQRIDERIRFEMRRMRPSLYELSRLKRMKQRARAALNRLMLSQAYA